MMSKKALILGVTGQDGSYLADLLLARGYDVYGMIRKSATGNTRNIAHLINNDKNQKNSLTLCRGDMTDPTSIYRILSEVQPDEVYNEADQDHVRWSFDLVSYSTDVTANAVMRLCEIIRQINPEIKLFQPCTSNMFGLTDETLLNEESTLNPQSPYAIGKTFSYHTARYYRNVFGMFISTAILFNHESPRRTPEYLSRKVTDGVARIKSGKASELVLGDLSAQIDWGYAEDYMGAAIDMLQLDEPSDYVIGSGALTSVDDFVKKAFAAVDLDWADYVRTSSEFIRPSKTSPLMADITKANRDFNFSPKTSINELVEMMVAHDLAIHGG